MLPDLTWQLPADERQYKSLQDWIQLAQAAEYAGLHAVHLSAGLPGAEPLVLASARCGQASRLALLTSIPPDVIQPAALVNAIQSLQSISKGRVRLHLPDADQGVARRRFGDWLNRDQRLERIGEYLNILRQLLWQPESLPLRFSGRYFQLENAGHACRPVAPPECYLDASQSPALLATYADVVIVELVDTRALAQDMHRLRALAAGQGRRLRFACRIDVLARASAALAWEEAEARLERIPPGRRRQLQPVSCTRLPCRQPGNDVHRYDIHPDIWQPCTEQPPVIVGDYQRVAARLNGLRELGVDSFILGAGDALGDILLVGEEVLARRGELSVYREGESRHA